MVSRDLAITAIAGTLVVTVVGAYAWLLAQAMMFGTYNHWGSLVVIPLIVLGVSPMLARAASREGERWFAILLPLAFLLKILGCLGRYFVAYVVYRGQADAETYNLYAVSRSLLWRSGVHTWEFLPSEVRGTSFIKVFNTGVYTIFGPSPLIGFVVFGCLSFWGTYLLYRAFRLGLPGADHRRYAYLIFLLPTMIYWPSSIGKEAYLMLTIGITAYGVARLFGGYPHGFLLIGLGLIASAFVRPHFAAMIVAAIMAAYAIRTPGNKTIGILFKLAGLLVFGFVAFLITAQTAAFLGIDGLTAESIATGVEDTTSRTQQGGSEFTPFPIRSPLDVVPATLTVLFRPLPYEARNIQMFVTSLEGLFLLGLLFASWRRLRTIPSLLRDQPYLTFSLTYLVLFVYAFSGFSNFGILARERSLIIPFLAVLLSLPLPAAFAKQRRVERELMVQR